MEVDDSIQAFGRGAKLYDAGKLEDHARLACWFESLAVAQFTRRGGRPL